jgi:hypothetical protein
MIRFCQQNASNTTSARKTQQVDKSTPTNLYELTDVVECSGRPSLHYRKTKRVIPTEPPFKSAANKTRSYFTEIVLLLLGTPAALIVN